MSKPRVVRFFLTLCCVILISTALRAATTAPASSNQPFPIADVSGNFEERATVAYDPVRQHYLVVNMNSTSGPISLNAVCLDQQGQVLATYLLGNGSNPDAIYDPSNDSYIVVWSNSGVIEANRVSGSCCIQVNCAGVPFTVSGDRPGTEMEPAIAYNQHSSHEDIMIVWTDYDHNTFNYEVWGRRMDGTTLMGSSFAISNPSTSWNYEPDVAYNSNMNEFIVVYTRDSSKGTIGGAHDIYSTRIRNFDSSLSPEQAIDTSGGTQDQPAVATYRLNQTSPYLVVFRDYWNDAYGDVRGYLLFKNDGSPHLLLNIATTPNVVEGNPKIHSHEPNGGYAISWTRFNPGDSLDVLWRESSSEGLVGATRVVAKASYNEWEGDIVNSDPYPFAVWTEQPGGDANIWARFLFEMVYLPALMRAR